MLRCTIGLPLLLHVTIKHILAGRMRNLCVLPLKHAGMQHNVCKEPPSETESDASLVVSNLD